MYTFGISFGWFSLKIFMSHCDNYYWFSISFVIIFSFRNVRHCTKIDQKTTLASEKVDLSLLLIFKKQVLQCILHNKRPCNIFPVWIVFSVFVNIYCFILICLHQCWRFYICVNIRQHETFPLCTQLRQGSWKHTLMQHVQIALEYLYVLVCMDI